MPRITTVSLTGYRGHRIMKGSTGQDHSPALEGARAKSIGFVGPWPRVNARGRRNGSPLFYPPHVFNCF